MTMTAQKPEVAVARVYVRCTGTIQKGKLAGQLCGKLLAEPRVKFWEIDMASEAILVCDKCGSAYTLAQYK